MALAQCSLKFAYTSFCVTRHVHFSGILPVTVKNGCVPGRLRPMSFRCEVDVRGQRERPLPLPVHGRTPLDPKLAARLVHTFPCATAWTQYLTLPAPSDRQGNDPRSLINAQKNVNSDDFLYGISMASRISCSLLGGKCLRSSKDTPLLNRSKLPGSP